MNKIIAFLLSFILATGVTPAALAQQYVEKQDISSSNLLSGLNPGAENGKAKWTASSAPTFSIITSGANLYSVPGSKATFSFDASAASQTVTSSSRAAGGFAGKSGVGSCYIKTTATDYKLQILKNGTMVAESAIGSLPEFTKVSVGFTYGLAADLYSTRIISASNAAALYYDVCSTDIAENSSASISQAAKFGSYKETSSCTYSQNTPSAWTDMPQTVGTCGTIAYSGGVSASGLGTAAIAFKIADMPAGDYLIQMTGEFTTANNAVAPQVGRWSLYDGTTRYGAQSALVSLGSLQYIGVNTLSFVVSKGASASDVVFRLQGHSPSQTAVNVDTDIVPLEITVFKFPSSSEQAQRVNEKSTYGTLKTLSAINITQNTGSYTTFSDASWAAAVKELKGSASACATANNVCIKLGKLNPGVYEVSLSGALYESPSTNCTFRMFDGVSEIGNFDTLTNAAIQRGYNGIKGTLTVNDVTYDKEISLQSKSISGTNCGVYASSESALEFQVKDITKNVNDLLLKNSLQSSSSGSEILNRVTVANCPSDPCTITSQTGSWVSLVTRNSVGNYTLTVSGFAGGSNPTCVGSTLDGVAGAPFLQVAGLPTSTAVAIQTTNTSFAATDSTNGFNLICTGIKQ